MKKKETFRRKIIRFYYSVKGWKMERKMKINHYYKTVHLPNSRFLYRGNKKFYEAYIAMPYPGVCYESQKEHNYKFWEIGILDFKGEGL